MLIVILLARIYIAFAVYLRRLKNKLHRYLDHGRIRFDDHAPFKSGDGASKWIQDDAEQLDGHAHGSGILTLRQ